MPGVTITSPLPVVGSTAGPTWATQLITWCNEIEADLEAKVVPSEINVNGNLEFNGNRAIELDGARFESQASASSGASHTNLLEVVSGDLYFVDGDGTSIQMTASGTINITTAGGIGGDYVSAGAALNYSSGSTEYTFNDHNASARPAGINVGNIALREKSAGSNAITIKSPTSLAGAYNWIMPTALPGAATEIVTVTTAGQLDTTGDPSVTTIAVSGLSSLDGGARFAGSGVGDDTLDFFADVGSATNARAFDPTFIHGGSQNLTYTTRYAYYTKVKNWVHAFISIIFTSDAGGSIAAQCKVRGLPYKAKGDSTFATDGNIVACGVCANYPPTSTGAQSGYVAASSIADTTSSGAVTTHVSFSQQAIPVMIDNDADIYFVNSGIMNSMTASENNEWDGATIPPTSSGTPLENGLGITFSSSGYHYITLSISYRAGGAV